MDLQESIKSMMDMGMPAADYARQEAWDIQTAGQALQIVAGLVSSESCEPDDMAKLTAIMQGLTDFINGEIAQMSEAVAQSAVQMAVAENAEPKSLHGDDELIAFGGELKALGDGKVGGYLVRFTTKDDPDLSGDFFTKDTDFGPASESIAWFHHRQPAKLENGKIMPALKKRMANNVSLKKDDFGVWAESVLDLRDEYEKFIYGQVVAGKMGYSSGTSPHTVDREIIGKGVAWVKTWPLGTDASYTPSPCEFRNTVTTVKSLSTPDFAALTSGDAVTYSKTINTIQENNSMTPEEIKAQLNALLDEREAEQKVRDTKAAEIKAIQTKSEEDGYKKAVDELTKKGMLKTPPAFIKALGSDSDDGAMAFKSWLATGQHNGELIQPDQNAYWSNTKSAFNVTTGASGSYLVPDPLYNIIQAKRNLMSFVRKAPVQSFQTAADHVLVPVEGTSMTNFVLTAEAASYDENEPTVAQVDLILYKYTKVIKMSEEFVNYQATNFDAWIANAFGRAEATTENTIYTTGTGSGQPLGVNTASGATTGNVVTTSAVLVPGDFTALVGLLGAGYNVDGETGFLMKNATKWYAKGLQTTGFFAFIDTPSGGKPTPGDPSGQVGQTGFLGYPAYVSDDMDAYTVAASTGHSLIYGNWNYYGIAERPGMLIQRNPYLYMANGQIALFANIYRGGSTLQQEAFYRTVGK